MTMTEPTETGSMTDQFAILETIRERVLASPDSLDMSSWHTCATTHCLAGWAQYLAGDQQADAESEGRRLIPIAQTLFFEKDSLVLAWLEARAWNPENLASFHAKLRSIGVVVATDDDVVEWTGGDLWAYGNSTVNVNASQSGGYLRAYGNSTVNVNASQSGGDLWADGNSTVNVNASQSGGYLRAYGNSTVNVNASQSGGYLRAYGNSTVNVNASQSGGYLRAYGNSTVNVNASQSGGDLWADGNSTVNVNASQSGGYLRAYGNSTVKHNEQKSADTSNDSGEYRR